jgi:hypothetical protein
VFLHKFPSVLDVRAPESAKALLQRERLINQQQQRRPGCLGD